MLWVRKSHSKIKRMRRIHSSSINCLLLSIYSRIFNENWTKYKIYQFDLIYLLNQRNLFDYIAFLLNSICFFFIFSFHFLSCLPKKKTHNKKNVPLLNDNTSKFKESTGIEWLGIFVTIGNFYVWVIKFCIEHN